MSTHTRACTRGAHEHECTHTCTSTHTHARTHARMHARMHEHTQTHGRTFAKSSRCCAYTLACSLVHTYAERGMRLQVQDISTILFGRVRPSAASVELQEDDEDDEDDGEGHEDSPRD